MKHSRVEKPPPPCEFLMYHHPLQIRCRFGSLKTGTSLHQHAGMGGAGGVIGVEDQWKPINPEVAFWVLSVSDPYFWVVWLWSKSWGKTFLDFLVAEIKMFDARKWSQMMLETCKLCCWLLDLWTHADLKWCDSCKPLRNKMKNKKLRSMPFQHNFCSKEIALQYMKVLVGWVPFKLMWLAFASKPLNCVELIAGKRKQCAK